MLRYDTGRYSLLFPGSAEGLCYFPAAFQGEYVTQAIMSGVPTISYSSLTVLFDSIPVWGVCHRRIGNNVILMDDTGGITCYKCFNLVLRSSNVLQVHTAGLDKCYTTEERAVADCPTDVAVRERRAREIMLFRKFDDQETASSVSLSFLESVLRTRKLPDFSCHRIVGNDACEKLRGSSLTQLFLSRYYYLSLQHTLWCVVLVVVEHSRLCLGGSCGCV